MSKAIIINPPIRRGESHVTEILLREPKAGELRGLKVINLMQGDAGEVIELLPRISEPALTKPEAAELDAPSMAEASLAVIGFFLKDESPSG